MSVMKNGQQQHGPGEEEEQQLELPPGFRFHPTDEEVISHYLTHKAHNLFFTCLVIADVDLNSCEPWDLPGKAKMGEKEWYFFWHKGRKYPTGSRTNRATPTGYWKATGRDKEIFRDRSVLVGMKKTLVFYTGRAPRGEKTPWVMHEYRLEGKLPAHLSPTAKDEWAVCRVFNKDLAAKQQQPGTQTVLSPADTGFDPGLPLIPDFPFIHDSDDLPALIDDFTDYKQGQGFAAAGTSSSSGGVKTEQPLPLDSYFSMPAMTSNNPGGRGGDQPPSAIRKHYNPKAPALLPDADMAPSSRPPLYPDLLLDGDQLDFLDYYSDMWKV